MKNLSAALLCGFLLAPAACSAQEAPAPKPAPAGAMKPAAPPSVDHHEFNADLPTVFSGEMADLPASEGQAAGRAYFSGDPASPRQIIVIHEWWGLNGHIKGTADQFAAMGYRVCAPNLYDADAAEAGNREAARALMSAASERPERLGAILGQCVEALRAENPEAKVASIGWCFGGGWSLQAGLRYPDALDACVVYYGQLVTDADALAALDGTPVQAVIASRDGWITPELGEEFKAAMEKAGQGVEVHVYEADHAFANPSGERFDKEAARAAWKETTRFLDENLGGGE